MFSKVDQRTEETLLKHLQAFGSGDIDAIMDDYDETSVLITPYGPKRGRAEIRSFFESFIPDFPPGSAFELSEQIVEGEIAYIVWWGESEKLRIPFGTDTFIVRGGKIVGQTFAGQIEEKASA